MTAQFNSEQKKLLKKLVCPIILTLICLTAKLKNLSTKFQVICRCRDFPMMGLTVKGRFARTF